MLSPRRPQDTPRDPKIFSRCIQGESFVITGAREHGKRRFFFKSDQGLVQNAFRRCLGQLRHISSLLQQVPDAGQECGETRFIFNRWLGTQAALVALTLNGQNMTPVGYACNGVNIVQLLERPFLLSHQVVAADERIFADDHDSMWDRYELVLELPMAGIVSVAQQRSAPMS